MDVKMGTAESSQSSELGGGIGGLGGQSSFHRQSPNVARLIRTEHSSKMEYEFPISDASGSASHHHHHHHHHHGGGDGSSSSNHTTTQHGSSGSRHGHQQHSHLSQQSSLSSPTNPGNLSTLEQQSKVNSNSNSRLWYSLTSCFGCRTRDSHHSSMNPLRDKVHAIRIVRASNDLTPAVFDSHYNIITLEQLRECDNNNGSGGGVGISANDSCDPSTSSNAAQNGNGSVASSKTDSDHRMKKKKKKRAATAAAAAAAQAAKALGSDDDDGSRRT